VVFKTLFVLYAALTIALVAVSIRLGEESTPSDVQLAALQWVGEGVAQEPRRDGDNWEVDVIRPDGSLVQVDLGDKLQLRRIDEETGPAGTLARDELRGAARARAVRVAFSETGPGHVVSAERDPGRQIEVSMQTADGRQVEVELDHRFRVLEVEQEDPRDE
jgi:hypothetical protein